MCESLTPKPPFHSDLTKLHKRKDFSTEAQGERMSVVNKGSELGYSPLKTTNYWQLNKGTRTHDL